MLKSNKHVFWEALLVTIFVFLIGLLIGIAIETGNSNKINSLYTKSEINLVDGLAVSQLSENLGVSCEVLREQNIALAQRVYEEAKLLETYETAGKLTDNLAELHKKYDLLRTLIWMSNQDSLTRCNNYNLVVYLYEYQTGDNTMKATQSVWSKILLDLVQERSDILLLPIATDQNLTSLDLLLEEYEVTHSPAVIINNDHMIYELSSTEDLQTYLS